MKNASDAAARRPAGPLALEWRGCALSPLRAGVQEWADVTVRNVGTVTWQPPDESERGVWLSFHWLDRLDNPIIWEGLRTPIPGALAPGKETTMRTAIRGPIPPGPYRLAFDLVDEGRCWFAEVGNEPLTLDVDVHPRLVERTIEVNILPGPTELVAATREALETQTELVSTGGEIIAYLPPGCVPNPAWSEQLLDAHDEGYAAVGGSVLLTGMRFRGRAVRAELRPWAPPFGRMPNWQLPLVCPSTSAELQNSIPLGSSVAGLPAIDMAEYTEPWLCDGRIRIEVPIRAVQQADHPYGGTRSPRL